MQHSISVVVPARNEQASVGRVVARVREVLPWAEVVVVNDGSTDATAEVAAAAGARVVTHPRGLGNGAAIKSGTRAAQGELLVFMDADGQHDPADIPRLLAALDDGYDMVVGSRNRTGQANAGRALANGFYNRFASWMTGYRIEDLTSGFRVTRAARFREFLSLLPNGFSYPSTSTIAFIRSAYPVGYLPIKVEKREGRSHIRPLRDGLRFLLIIFRIASLYSPLKLFVPVSGLFVLLGLGNYAYTFAADGRFTNMSALLISAGVLTFMIGLVSEQITQLTYRRDG
jgi:glycosyltransferase involved in cell wall biosynthesis